MLDSSLRPKIDPVLNYLCRYLSKFGLKPSHLTVFGLILVPIIVILLAEQQYIWALIVIMFNRLMDGLDGSLARHMNQSTLLGAYLDIVFDFIFYASVPLGFALGNPQDHGIIAVILLFSFIGTGSSFLAFALINEKIATLKISSYKKQGFKAFHYVAGLTEGSETIIFMILICIFPEYFPWIGGIFAGLCVITTSQRIYLAVQHFKGL